MVRAFFLCVSGLLFFLAEAASGAATVFQCVVCNVAVSNQVFMVQSPAFDDPQPVCPPCSVIPLHCAACTLPIRSGATKLIDGRLLCGIHAKTAIFTERQGKELFREVMRELMRMLNGTGKLPDQNITFAVVSKPQLFALLAGQSQIHSDSTLGLTRTRVNEDRSQDHFIYVLDGLMPAHFMSVCAHEYAHTWLNQNVSRHLDPHMAEAFCELIAYKLMDAYRHEGQKRAVLANTYTQGRIEALIKAEHGYRFDEVIKWMKSGTEETFALSETDRVLSVNSTMPSLHNIPAALKTAVPDQLVLKGISGKEGRRFALINDRTMIKDETGRVRVGETNVLVRCVSISADAVLLKLIDSGEMRELFLSVE